MANKAKEGAINLVNNVINTIKELPGKMLDAGKNIVEGLWNGIKNATGWIIGKVKEFAKGILDGMKNALGIHSPSTLFRDEVGKFIPQGVAVGIEADTDSAIKSIDNMNKKMQKSFDLDSMYNKMKSAVNLETQKLSTNLTTNAVLKAGTDTAKTTNNDNSKTINCTQNFYEKESTPYEEQKQAKQQLRRLAYGLS